LNVFRLLPFEFEFSPGLAAGKLSLSGQIFLLSGAK
jgi:hypothetical protein